MDRIPDVLELARALIREDTTNPPGNEEACASLLRGLLEAGGFRVERYAHAPSRTSFIARAGAENPRRSLCFVGHLDTVPLGKGAWTHPPFAAEIHDGRLYGRGACDMKSGVAAFVCAALQRAQDLPADCGLVLILTAGEETGCEGSRFIAELGTRIDGLEGVIVGEPTGNMPLVGHKGALWLRASFAGVAAHGSMPSAGDNAIFKGVDAVLRLRHFCAGRAPHPVLGAPTLNIGTFHAGENVNSVPDHAALGLDLRTTPGLDHGELRREIADAIGAEHALEVTTSMAPVYTSAEAPWVQRVFALIAGASGRTPVERAAPFFTDASALAPVTGGAPTLILGPGEPVQMHKVDEYCEVAQIHEAVRLYRAIIDDAFAAPRSLELTESES